jgi:hypothetical protein
VGFRELRDDPHFSRSCSSTSRAVTGDVAATDGAQAVAAIFLRPREVPKIDTAQTRVFATDRFRRVEGALLAARAWSSRPRNKRWLLLIAFAIFVVLAVISFQNLPDGVALQPGFMVAIALIAAPAGWLLNTFEYRSIAKAAGHRVSLDTALQVTLAVNLANLLPVPGGVAVKTAALKLEGSSLGSAVSVNAIAGIIWIGATAALVGIALLTDPDFVARGAVVATVGAAMLGGAALSLRRRLPGWRRVFVELVAALRTALAFAAIGETASIAAFITIASAHVLAVAIGFFPAGLGLSEALAAALALTVQVSPAVAVAASAVERVSSAAGRILILSAMGLHLRNASRRRVGKDSTSATPAELDARGGSAGGNCHPRRRDSDQALD